MPSSENTRRKIMLYNIIPFQKDRKEDFSLQHISILLNTINKTFELLDQQVSVYRQDVKNHTFLFYGPRDDFETHVQIIPDIQKELEVYHYYKEVIIKLLCEFFCSKDRQKNYGCTIIIKNHSQTFARNVFAQKTSTSLNDVNF